MSTSTKENIFLNNSPISKPPVFIIGCPRSGTSLTSQLLEFSSYGSPIETHFIPKYYKKLGSYGDLKQNRNLEKLLKDILKERPMVQWKLEIDIVHFPEMLTGYEYSEIVNKMCQILFKQFGKSSWGDKTPDYIFDLDIIFGLFPDSKYIYIVRDGRDVALSLLRKEWGPNNIFSCAEYWKKCNQKSSLLDLMRKKGQVLDIKYEDLLCQPAEITKSIYKFLDESYPENALRNLINSINKNNFDKWKREMKAKNIKIFEMVASDTLKLFGYEASFPEDDVERIYKWYWRFHNYVFHIIYLIKLNIIDTIRIKFFGMEPFND